MYGASQKWQTRHTQLFTDRSSLATHRHIGAPQMIPKGWHCGSWTTNDQTCVLLCPLPFPPPSLLPSEVPRCTTIHGGHLTRPSPHHARHQNKAGETLVGAPKVVSEWADCLNDRTPPPFRHAPRHTTICCTSFWTPEIPLLACHLQEGNALRLKVKPVGPGHCC